MNRVKCTRPTTSEYIRQSDWPEALWLDSSHRIVQRPPRAPFHERGYGSHRWAPRKGAK